MSNPTDWLVALQPFQSLILNNVASFLNVNSNVTISIPEPIVALAALGCLNMGALVVSNGNLSADLVHQISAALLPGNESQQQLLRTALYAMVSGAGAVMTKELAESLFPNGVGPILGIPATGTGTGTSTGTGTGTDGTGTSTGTGTA